MVGVNWRLPGLALGAIAQIFLTIAHPPLALGVNVVLGLVGGILVLQRPSRRRIAIMVMWLLSLLAMVSTLAHQQLRYPSILGDGGTESGEVELVLTRTFAPGDQSVPAVLVASHGQSLARIPIRLFLDAGDTRLAPGTTLSVRGALLPTERFDADAWRLFADDAEVLRSAPKVFQRADAMREAFLRHSMARGGDGGALLPGLALGDTQAVSDSLEADMRVAALAHLVAVSGANSALVVGLVVVATALCGGGIWWRLVLGVLALIGFVILVTPEPSIVRASVMATLALFAVVAGRPARGISVLSLAVWLLVLLDPWRSVQFAFVLSVLATGGIVLGLAPMARFLSRGIPEWMSWVVALPLVAQLAVQPVVILLRPTLPVYGVLANIVAAPLAPLVTVLGLVGSVGGAVLSPIGVFAAWLGWWPAAAIAAIARTVATLPAAEVPWIPGASGALAMAVVSAAVWWAVMGSRPRFGIAIAGLLVAAVVATQSAPTVAARLSRPEQWQIAQCDVGQGDALLVNTSAGVVAIDTGDDEHLLRRCLQVMGVSSVEVLVLTHFDRDHVGQTEVFRSRVRTVITGPPDNGADQVRLQDLEDSGAVLTQVSEGDRIDVGDYRLTVWWPTTRELAEPGNDSSVVVSIDPTAANPSGLSMVALGDIGEEGQMMLRPRLAGLAPDVVKVSHHGSADQSLALYRELGAEVALIGVGANNDYGHPTPRALDILHTTGATVLRSDERGTLTLHREGEEIWVWSERGQ